MSQIDIAILLVILVFTSSGFFRGFFREIISLLGTTGGFLAAVWKTAWLYGLISGVFPWSSPFVFIAVFLGIFFVCSFLLSLMLEFLYHQMKSPSLGILQRTAGSVLGLLKGVLFASVSALIFSLFPLGQKMTKEKETAVLLHPIRAAAPAVLQWTARLFPQTESNYPEVKEQFNHLGTSSKKSKDDAS